MHHNNAGYAAMVYSLDENVGRILAKIDELGQTSNTLLIFISDNGGFISRWDNQVVTSNYPLRSGKGALYEGGVRIPMIVRFPGTTEAGTVCDQAVSTMDIYPTILQALGIENSEDILEPDGESLFSLLKDPEATLNRKYLFWHYPHYYIPNATPSSSVRFKEWKLIEFFENGQLELYNLKDDPGEEFDLSEKLPGQARELQKVLNKWREDVDAQLPSDNPGL